MRIIFSMLAVGVLAGCGLQKEPFTNLTRDSYGPLADYVDKDTGKSVTVPSCDPNAKYTDVAELSRRITAAVFKPVSRLDKIDDSILKEDLQDKFRIPGDVAGRPTVVLLHRDKNGIVFWYYSDLVILPEVTEAAKAYCKNQNGVAIYEGSSRKCGEPKPMPVVVNGQTTMIETYAISSFRCIANPTSSPTEAVSSPSPSDPEFVRTVQAELRRLGMLNSVADGIYGPKTAAAISEYQRRKGLPVDGHLSQALLDSLKGN